MSLLKNSAIDLLLVQTTDGTSDPDGRSVDMLGFDGCVFVCIVGTITGSGTVNMSIAQSSDDSTYNAITGAAAQADLAADSDKPLVVDVYKPGDRYLRPTVTRSTAASILGGIVSIRYKGRKAPFTQNTSMHAATPVLVASGVE